jgi:uncharacterized protein DUF5666
VIQEPTQPTASPPQGPARTRRTIAPWIVIAALGLTLAVIAVVIVAMAHPPRSDAPLAAVAGASTAPEATEEPDGDDDDQGGKSDKADKLNNGNHGNKNGGAPGKGPITIRSIAGPALSLSTEDGWTRTITVTSSTVINKGGQTISVGDLKVGDEIRFSQVRNADATYSITAIVVSTPVAGGEVTAVDTTTITVKGRRGETSVITVNGSTAYKLGSAAATKADVKVGVRVTALGTRSGDTFTAITVTIRPAEIGGVVTSTSSDSITVKRGDGSTTVIHVTPKTTFELKGNESGALTDVAVGDRVSAEGVLRADGSIDASSVEARGPKGGKPATAASAVPS